MPPDQPAEQAEGQARKELRSSPLADDLRPVRPGLSGGAYKPLDNRGVSAISDTIFQILEEIGLSQARKPGSVI